LRKRTLGSDSLIKLLIQGSGGEPFGQLKLGKVNAVLNVDLPRTQDRRVDLVYRSVSGRLVHIEVQSTNDPLMPLRMAEYGLAVTRAYGQYPEQLVLYVGNEPLRMKSEFREGGMVCRYRLVDIRSLDGDALLATDTIADNILALLTRLRHPTVAVRMVLGRIGKLRRGQRRSALEMFLLTCQMRGLDSIAGKELKAMQETVYLDLDKMPKVKAALVMLARRAERRRARAEGMRETLQLALKKRFGRIPATVTKRVAKMSDLQAQETLLAILDAKSLKDLFGSARR